MPFINLDKGSNPFNNKKFDIILIGAGAAGIMLAVKLTKSGKRVLLLESGHFEIDEMKQRLNEVESTGKTMNNIVWGRKRAIGGTTLAWGGQSLPFSPLDFQKRSWVENSGWPLEYAELVPYYKEANSFMGIDTLDYRKDIFEKAKIANPGFDPALVDFHVSKWAAKPNFRKLYNEFLATNVTVVYNAHVKKLTVTGGIVEKIELQNFKKKNFIVQGSAVVITAGTVESVRLLLNNNIGNSSGMLGKCFMEHPCIELGKMVPVNEYKFQQFFNTHIWKKKKYSVRLSLSEKIQKDKELLNCSAGFMFYPPAEKFDPYAAMLSLKRQVTVKNATGLLKAAPQLFRSAAALLRHRFYYKVNADVKVVLMTEQAPLTSSAIMLSNEEDEFGSPKAKICWQISRATWKTVVESARILQKEIELLKLGTVKLYDHINAAEKNWPDHLSDVNHHMGGCRMSPDENSGIVDRNLKVWNVSNLYVCSCAVFPTSSHSNPTLTMLALGARLASSLSAPK